MYVPGAANVGAGDSLPRSLVSRLAGVAGVDGAMMLARSKQSNPRARRPDCRSKRSSLAQTLARHHGLLGDEGG